jgi:hypothetical protein
MKLGTLISVSGAIDFPHETKFNDLTPIVEPKVDPAILAPRKNDGNQEQDRFRRIWRWIIVALLSLAAVA